MDTIYQAKNGSIEFKDAGANVKVTTRESHLSYAEIKKVVCKKGTINRDCTVDIYTKDKGNMRLRFQQTDNEVIKSINNEFMKRGRLKKTNKPLMVGCIVVIFLAILLYPKTPRYVIVESDIKPLYCTYRIVVKPEATEKDLLKIFNDCGAKEYDNATIWFYSSIEDAYSVYTVGMVERKSKEEELVVTMR